jgi:hypothetical protein
MNFRTVSKIALATGGLMAAVFACSAPDPGQVIFTPRTDNATGGTGTGTNNQGNGTDGGSSGGGTDSGTTGGGGGEGGAEGGGATLTAFTGDTYNAAGTPSSGNAKDVATHQTAKTSGGMTIPGGDPKGMNCMDSACHGTGGAGSPWAFAGTAYTAAGTTAPMGTEIRLVDKTGKEVDHVYTDVSGNFYSNSQNTVATDNLAGCRNATKTNQMVSKTVAAGCNATGCHAAGANPMMAP